MIYNTKTDYPKGQNRYLYDKYSFIRNEYIKKLVEAEELSVALNSTRIQDFYVSHSAYDKILKYSCLLNDKIVEIMVMRENYPACCQIKFADVLCV